MPSARDTPAPLPQKTGLAPPWTPGPAFTGSGPIKTSLQSETREGGDYLQLFFCAANRWLPPSSLVSAPHPPPNSVAQGPLCLIFLCGLTSRLEGSEHPSPSVLLLHHPPTPGKILQPHGHPWGPPGSSLGPQPFPAKPCPVVQPLGLSAASGSVPPPGEVSPKLCSLFSKHKATFPPSSQPYPPTP